MPNDVLFNIENDLDKDQRVTVYLTLPEKEALRKYADAIGSSESDVAGGWIWPRLKQMGLLPEGYSRPPGF